jgi:glutathione S-transferase
MKLYWSSRSPFVRKVMVCAHETGLAPRIELERTLVVMSQPNLQLMRHNPLGRIPTLVTDDGRVLHDSLIICEYLDSLHAGPKLFPASGEARWQALLWHALGNGMLETLVLWRNETLKPEPQRGADLLAAFELKTRSAVDALEHEAETLARTPFGIGHVAVGVALGYIDFRFSGLGWRTGHPALAAWYAQFAQRPSAQATEPIDA